MDLVTFKDNFFKTNAGTGYEIGVFYILSCKPNQKFVVLFLKRH